MTPRSASRFAKTVPSPATPDAARDPLAFVRALMASRTLREAVTQIRARSPGDPVYRDGIHFAALTACWRDDGAATPAVEFITGRPWSRADEQTARRNVYAALSAWGFLVDELATAGGPCRVARRWHALSAEECVALALMLVGVSGTVGMALKHPAWSWLGWSRDDVSRGLYDAHARGLCEVYESGSVVHLRFRDADGTLYDAADRLRTARSP